MSEGHKTVEKIMPKIRRSIKDGIDPQTNKPNYNIIYEALWDLVDKLERLRGTMEDTRGVLQNIFEHHTRPIQERQNTSGKSLDAIVQINKTLEETEL